MIKEKVIGRAGEQLFMYDADDSRLLPDSKVRVKVVAKVRSLSKTWHRDTQHRYSFKIATDEYGKQYKVFPDWSVFAVRRSIK